MSIVGKINPPDLIQRTHSFIQSYLRSDETDFNDIYGNGLFRLLCLYRDGPYDKGRWKDKLEHRMYLFMLLTHNEIYPNTDKEQFFEMMTLWLKDSVTTPGVKKYFTKLLENMEKIDVELTPEEPYLTEEVVTVVYKYNSNYGDDRVCMCGHEYYRHFDTYDDMAAVGCKYCDCMEFVEKDDE